jgi:hypothetical protein
MPEYPEGAGLCVEKTREHLSNCQGKESVTVIKVSHWFDQCDSKRFDHSLLPEGELHE